jgi:hypothetical protein
MYDLENELQTIRQYLYSLRNTIAQLKAQIEEAEEYAPDASEDASDKVEEAEEILEEAEEHIQEMDEKFRDFGLNQSYARQLNDQFQTDKSPQIQKELRKAEELARRSQDSLLNTMEKSKIILEKTKNAIEKAAGRVKIAQIKAQNSEERDRSKKVRINFTLPEDMKDDWRKLADDLNISVSQLVRNAMDSFEKGIHQLDELDKSGKLGRKLEELGHRIEKEFSGEVPPVYTPSQPTTFPSSAAPNPPAYGQPSFSSESARPSTIPLDEKDRMKKRVKGLIKLQKCIPIDKFAQALNVSETEAENIIYELAAEGVEGSIESGVFTFKKNGIDEVISDIEKIIDRM